MLEIELVDSVEFPSIVSTFEEEVSSPFEFYLVLSRSGMNLGNWVVFEMSRWNPFYWFEKGVRKIQEGFEVLDRLIYKGLDAADELFGKEKPDPFPNRHEEEKVESLRAIAQEKYPFLIHSENTINKQKKLVRQLHEEAQERGLQVLGKSIVDFANIIVNNPEGYFEIVEQIAQSAGHAIWAEKKLLPELGKLVDMVQENRKASYDLFIAENNIEKFDADTLRSRGYFDISGSPSTDLRFEGGLKIDF